ncbi:MAG TPA: hypothetical protein VGF47_02725 [Solirubrobacteraceae bacterium]
MTTAVVQTRGLRQAPRLRFLPAQSASASRRPPAVARATADAKETSGPKLRLHKHPAQGLRPVLLAGGDVAAREAVRRDLAHSMSPSTVIEQVGAVWEVLARAAESRIVIISGRLEDVSAESLMQMLAHRHPGLPVVCLEGSDALQSTPVAC